MRILVTGSQGYLGSRLCAFLKKKFPRARLVGTSRRSTRPGEHACSFEKGVAVQDLLAAVRPTLVFHCIGTIAPGPWDRLVRAHLLPMTNLLEAVRQFPGVKSRVVVVGSSAEYGPGRPGNKFSERSDPRPESAYGLSKYLQTTMALGYARLGVPVLVARLFNLLTPDAPETFAVSRVAQLLRRIPRGSSVRINVGPMDAVRDYLPLEEALEALSVLGTQGKPGEIYNVCSGRGTRMGDLFDALAEGRGAKVRWTSAGRGSQRSKASFSVGDGRKIRRHTGWRPRADTLGAARGFLA
jgi:nucleoside-diphosphate-sugar epimerase